MKFSAVFFVLMSTVSCSTVDNQPCEINHSRAYCLLNLVGISDGVEDTIINARSVKHSPSINETLVNSEKISEEFFINYSLGEFSRKINQDDLLAAAIYQFGGKSIPSFAPGIPSLPLLFFGLSGQQAEGRVPGLFAVVPTSEIKYNSSMRTVEIAMMEAVELVTGSTIEREPHYIKHNGLFNKETWRVFKMYGGRCGEDQCYFHMDFSLVEGSEWSKSKFIESPPAWLSKESVQAHTKTVPRYYVLTQNGNKINIMYRTDYETIFKHLPKWIYFYAPDQINGIFNSEGIMPLVTTSKN